MRLKERYGIQINDFFPKRQSRVVAEIMGFRSGPSMCQHDLSAPETRVPWEDKPLMLLDRYLRMPLSAQVVGAMISDNAHEKESRLYHCVHVKGLKELYPAEPNCRRYRISSQVPRVFRCPQHKRTLIGDYGPLTSLVSVKRVEHEQRLVKSCYD